MEEGILCATDAAGRDLDIPPSVDWVVQFEPPDDPTEYILRVARISCDSDRVGRSLLFLNPGETGFLKYYHAASIPVSEFEIPKLAEIQSQIEYHVNESDRFLKYAKDAYGSYLIAYASHSFRDVYNVHDLNKSDVAAAFGHITLPSICDGSDDEVSVGSSEAREHQAPGQAPKEGARRTWNSNKKKKEKTWMKGEKTWPHCQIKVHPKFRENYIPRDEDES
jgi:ATP-dependent RNA helicase DDX18/HAS1